MSERPAPVERRLRRLVALLALPGLLATLALVAQLPLGTSSRVCLALLATLAWGGAAWWLLEAFTQPLRGLANVVESLRAGDYMVRGRTAARGDAFGDLVHEINSLGASLHEQRLRTLEATALLDRLIAAVDVAVYAVDGEGRVRLCNPAGARLLDRPVERVVGERAEAFGLAELCAVEPGTRVVTAVGGRPGRWQVTLGRFREGGLSQHLLVVADVQRALREEERAAWQRLIRVIGHEVNNSLAPIKSLAGTLRDALAVDGAALPGDDVREGLRVIEERTHGLGRFLAQYSRLARLPAPRPARVEIAPLLDRVAALGGSPRVRVDSPAGAAAWCDADLVEQALINLVKNAREAAGESGSVVLRAVPAADGGVVFEIEDDGPGIANPDNLFVPFFTTKSGGSGIGLVLSRQIAEAHGGTLTLANRADARGAIARVVLPRTG